MRNIPTPPNLQQRKLAVARDVPYVQKDSTVSTGSGSYLAVSHDAVIAALRGAMIEHGIALAVTQGPEVVIEGQTRNGSPKVIYRSVYDITLLNADDPTDRETTTLRAHAEDGGDKAPGKGLSYAVKYALLKVFLLETGEDDEQRHAPGEVTVITDEQAADLSALIDEVQADRAAFVAYYRIGELADMPAAKLAGACELLRRRRTSTAAAQ